MRQIIKVIGLGLISIFSVCGTAQAELLIGRLGTLKNPIGAPTTISSAEGFDLYVKKVNDAGGINGEPLRVIFRDDEFNPKLVVERAQQLIDEDKVLAIVLPQGTPGTLALNKSGVLKEAGIALVAPFGDVQVLASPNVFPIRSSYDDEVAALARQMTIIGQKRVAYFYYNTSQGPLFAPVFEKIVKAAGLDYVGAVGFDIDPAPEVQARLMKEAMTKLGALHPDAVFTFAVGPTFPIAMRQMLQTLGRGVTRYTFSINNWQTLIKQIGEEDARGMVFSQSVPYPYNVARKIVVEYRDALKKGGPALTPSFAGLEGYMAAKVLVTAIRHAGPKPTKEKVLAALESLGRYDLGDYVLNYSPVLHKAEPSVDITIIGSQGRLIK
ncbi:ABC transporter substrate-binding protein [Candidatus Aalborgicola defluviihabitans]|jgi:ABC-type branched-subunit amino acid transport system substrate-binding protein|uniref:ABC transporter substrate-binding protein n=1 Tax=Candidatus Aalborgicola defluviihabitans TaxID=3386187 RepID=UPI001E171405|nr:ABC transporter substrate-binding protein [Burkholderiales bacterium]MBK7280194.1 ABC transporter substrate-binding protein [Burkholderiales bacterium]MBK7314468.1 ABC transporter substrate-binding protein [Burkholderiales bacterium]MBL0244193.1 ABC transporter substrate-binding protein [Rhodoferax sp.]